MLQKFLILGMAKMAQSRILNEILTKSAFYERKVAFLAAKYLGA